MYTTDNCVLSIVFRDGFYLFLDQDEARTNLIHRLIVNYCRALVFDLDNAEPKLRFHYAADLPRLQGESRVFKGLDHLSALKPTQFATSLGAVIRILTRK